VTIDGVLSWTHLVAAAVWTGGLIVLGSVVASLRATGAGREALRAVARGFGRVSWPAMAVAVTTGSIQASRGGWDGPLAVKTVLVGLVIVLAAVHQASARRTSPAVRGALQGVILVVSLAVFAAAVAL
jgi:putative copper export protein